MRRFNIFGRNNEVVKISDYIYETEKTALQAAKEYELEELLRRANAVIVAEAKPRQPTKPSDQKL
jgi:hypothetical protein